MDRAAATIETEKRPQQSGEGRRFIPEPDEAQPAGAPLSASDPRPESQDAVRIESVTEAPEGVRPVRPRAVAVTILAILAAFYTIYFARSLLLPVVIAGILYFLFRPAARWLERRHVPSTVSAAGVLLLLVGAAGTGIYFLADPAAAWIRGFPAKVREVEQKYRHLLVPLKQMEQASEEVAGLTPGGDDRPADGQDDTGGRASSIGEAGMVFGPAGGSFAGTPLVNGASREHADDGVGAPPDAVSDTDAAAMQRERVQVVQIKQPSLTRTVLGWTGDAIAGIAITLVLLYLLLALGDSFLNRVVELMPTFRDKRGVVTLVRDIERGISQYLVTVTAINIGLGTAIGTALWLLGMSNPLLWGVMAAALNFIPYIGAVFGTVVVFLAALVEFNSPGYAALAPLAYYAINSMEGQIITPIILGRRMDLNPIIVFLSLTFWGWMWGIGGVLIAVPVLGVVKITCDHFQLLRPIGALIGR